MRRFWLPPRCRRGIGMFAPGCCWCDVCDHCDGATPQELDVTFSGFANGTCSECTTLNTTFTLPLEGENPSGNCIWFLDITNQCSGNINAVRASLIFGGGTYHLDVTVEDSILAPRTTFIKDFGGTSPVCEDWSSLSVPLDNQDWSGVCDAGASPTCTVTAL